MSQSKNSIQQENMTSLDRMNVVVIGHVDHGKSTLIGRLMADTNALPEGKLEQVKEMCRRTSKPFEYAFLLDALKDEQSQGITIDTARCFFKSKKREYIIIDAPGHIEFLKNMISGAARAEAAILVIDAEEGIQENSRRHGYMMSMLGIKQIVVAVNKMDLVDYDESIFNNILKEYSEFLVNIHIKPDVFIPVSAREGDNIAEASERMPWYSKKTILEAMDDFRKERSLIDKPFRFPVQDIYKFTAEGDSRRIIAGRVESGSVRVGDDVVFLPSMKRSKIVSIEEFNAPPKQEALSGDAAGFTLAEQIYINPGEIMCKDRELMPKTATSLRANMFWLGRRPMIKNKKYKLKLGTCRIPVWLGEVNSVLDASELSSVTNKTQIDRHDVADCVLHTFKPIALDLADDISPTGRFVIVDDYEIAGGGIVVESYGVESKFVEEHIRKDDQNWKWSEILAKERQSRYGHKAMLVIITGHPNTKKQDIARLLERELLDGKHCVYYLGVSNALAGIGFSAKEQLQREECIRRLGEISHIFTNAGFILITTVSDLDDYEFEILKTLNASGDMLLVNTGESKFQGAEVDLLLPAEPDVDMAVKDIKRLLQKHAVFLEYYL